MTPALFLSVMLAPVAADDAKAGPASIPERWLLKYAPKDMPPLPDAFAKNVWNHRWFPRVARLSWEEWIEFTPATAKHPGAATITRADTGEDNKPRLTVRTVPLAVYGRLVEYDGRLYTAAIGRWAHEQPTPTDVLDLGHAVELPGNVWYQAASLSEKDGPTWVQEWRLEFSDDPRIAKKGTVKVFGFARETTATDGNDFVAELRFVRTKEPHEKTWSVKLIAEDDAKLPKSGLPVLMIDPDRNRASIYDREILNQMFPTLGETRNPAPKLETGPAVGLMQPPKKK